MNAQELFHAIGNMEDRYVLEADIARIPRKAAHKAKRLISLAAACFAIVLLTENLLPPAAPDVSALPKLSGRMSNDRGFGGSNNMVSGDLVFCSNIKDVVGTPPWRKADRLNTLPVYLNPNDPNYVSDATTELTLEQMWQKAEELVAFLGLHEVDRQSSSYHNKITSALLMGLEGATPEKIKAFLSGSPEQIQITCQEGFVTVYRSGSFEFSIDNYHSIPNRYIKNLQNGKTNHQAITKYLLRHYREILDFDSPMPATPNLSFLTCDAYEARGGLQEQIVNYHFNNMSYSIGDDENGKPYFSLLRNRVALSVKIGDYPLINPDEAYERLMEGHYQAWVMNFTPQQGRVAHVEIAYDNPQRSGNFSVAPFFRFYVEVPPEMLSEGDKQLGEKAYAIFYVSAIQAEFLKELPMAEQEDDLFYEQGR